jgi:hypothetical protein
MTSSIEFSKFNLDSVHIMEGYTERFTNSIDPFFNFTEKTEGYQTELVEYNKVKHSMASPASMNNYDVIDNSGNLIYKKDLNFKETIPKLKDAVLDDSINVMNYNNNVYAISGIAIAFLIIGIIISSR